MLSLSRCRGRTGLLSAGQRHWGIARLSHSLALTADVYKVKRGDYAKLNQNDIESFKTILGEGGVITDADDLAAANTDWMGKYTGQSKLLLKPKTTEQISKILRHCNERKLAVVPQGGNTGLVGGSVPVLDEIIISLAGLSQIRGFDELSGILTADAGVILENADNYANEKGYIFPLDLGAKGSCQIGGNAATNAGGLRLLRYGSLHGSILGIEAVLPNGDIFNGLSTLRKDNTGYDLKQLFIGSEGTLGIITGLSILCPPKPKVTNVAFLGIESFENMTRTFIEARKHLSEILSSFECMDNHSLELVAKYYPPSAMQPPLDGIHPFSLLIETSGSNDEHDQAKLQEFLEDVMEKGLITDGVLATDETQLKNLWAWRETIPEASNRGGGVYKYDVSLPLPAMWELVNETRNRLESKGLLSRTDESKPAIDAIGYGHIGDGNLHLNVAVRSYNKEIEDALEPWVFEFVSKYKGSVSAEHGLGFQKAHALHYSKSAELIGIMRDVKRLFDPNGILNPYKYLE